MGLTAKQIERETVAGRYFDGNDSGLLLTIRQRGQRTEKSWSLRYAAPASGKRREKGLGAFPAVTLTEARSKAIDLRKQISAGIDPLEVQQRDPAGVTFADATTEFIKLKASGWKGAALKMQWENAMATYCAPINGKPVGSIGREDVLAVLSPIWLKKPETASRVRGRMQRILDFATAKSWRSDDLRNPAEYDERLKSMLPEMPKRTVRVRHHPAMSWQEVPDFIAALRQRPAVSARLLEFTILTAARIGESGGATFGECNAGLTAWTVPAARMKMQRAHAVPLSRQAAAIIKAMPATQGLIFPIGGKSPSENATRALLQRMGRADVTTHGFRSSFRDWCADSGVDRELAEACLAHIVGGVEGAYRRSDMLERRRELLQRWADFCHGVRSK